MGGSPDIEYPQPTAAELALQNLSLGSALRSEQLTEEFMPYVMSGLGLKRGTLTGMQDTGATTTGNPEPGGTTGGQPVYYDPATDKYVVKQGDSYVPYNSVTMGAYKNPGENTYSTGYVVDKSGATIPISAMAKPEGALTKMSDEEYYNSLTSENQRQYDITHLEQDRLTAALKGELPIDKSVEDALSAREQQVREYLSQKMGPDYESTTAGIQALSELDKENQAIRYQVQHGELTSGAATLQAGLQGGNQEQVTNTGIASSIPLGYSSSSQLYSGLLAPYMNQRANQYQASMANAANAQSGSNSLMSGLGYMGGMIGSQVPWGSVGTGLMSMVGL